MGYIGYDWPTVWIPHGATRDEYIEACLEVRDKSAGLTGVIVDDDHQVVIVYNATELEIDGAATIYLRQYPDHIGPVTDDDDTTDTEPDPVDTEPEPVEPTLQGEVTARALNVRSEPRVVAGNVVAQLPGGTVVYILDDTNTYWYQIALDIPAGHGWVSKKYIRLRE